MTSPAPPGDEPPSVETAGAAAQISTRLPKATSTSSASDLRRGCRSRHGSADIDRRLAALNGILQHGFFDSGDSEGLRQILWRNRSLQEFCAAYWMSQFCTEQDAQTLGDWLYLPDDLLSEAYYWIWRYATEMPATAGTAERWPLAMSPLYQPGRRPDRPPLERDDLPQLGTRWNRYRRFFEHRTHEEILEALYPQAPFSSLEGAQRRQELQAWGRSILSESNGREQLARHLASPNIDGEVVKDRQQKMQAYELCRDPVLNRWYRLFDPQHGLRPSWYREDYARYSPAAGTPVIYVSWYDAWVFSRWARWAGVSCHLPSERQWEYAAKAGKDDWHYWWGDDFSAEKCNAIAAVGRTTAPSDSHCNPWGLRDILGNVWEWCQDWYGEYDLDLADGPGGGSYRVCRGGGWFDWPSGCRSAFRGWNTPEGRLLLPGLPSCPQFRRVVTSLVRYSQAQPVAEAEGGSCAAKRSRIPLRAVVGWDSVPTGRNRCLFRTAQPFRNSQFSSRAPKVKFLATNKAACSADPKFDRFPHPEVAGRRELLLRTRVSRAIGCPTVWPVLPPAAGGQAPRPAPWLRGHVFRPTTGGCGSFRP
jgi:hypothetical protein